MIDYIHDGRQLLWGKQVITLAEGEHYEIVFSARDVHRERTGTHAQITIVINGVTLAFSTFNVDRDEDRVRLANSTFRSYEKNGLALDYPATFIKKDLDDFCYGLWDEQIKEFMPESMGGTLEPTKPTFLLDPYVIEGGGTILFAPPGRGKSWSALLMAVAIDAGISTSLWVVKQARVLFLNLERSVQSFRNRLGAVNMALGLSRERPLDILNARGRSLSDVYTSCERWVQAHGTECVVLDSLSRAGLGDMTENLVGNRTMDLMNALSSTWFAPAHAPRADTSHVYGSQMYDAAADVIVAVLSEQSEEDLTLGIGLRVTKANDFRAPPMQLLAYEFDEYGLHGIRRANPGEFLELEAGRKSNTVTEISEYILDQDGAVAGAQEIATALERDRSYVSKILTSRKDRFVFVRKEGRAALYGVIGHPS